MELDEVLRDLVGKTNASGSCVLHDLVQIAKSQNLNGIGVGVTPKRESFILFLGGDPEGALISDSYGILVGDKATLQLDPGLEYEFHVIDPAIIEGIVLRTRIFDKSHLNPIQAEGIFQIGKKTCGIGILTLTVSKEGILQPGVHLSIRHDGHVVGNDVTDKTGKVSFRLIYGMYDCTVSSKDQRIRLYTFAFTPESPRIVLEISDTDTVLPAI
jgi:hypothetical protein